MADAPLRRVSDDFLCCYCHIDLLGPIPEDIEVNFGLGPCARPHTLDHENMELERE